MSNLARQVGNEDYYIDFDVEVTGARTQVRTFHFDAYASNSGAARNWTLTVESGDLTLGSIARGSLNKTGEREAVDII